MARRRRMKEEETHEESENYGILLHILCIVGKKKQGRTEQRRQSLRQLQNKQKMEMEDKESKKGRVEKKKEAMNKESQPA